jgi:diguanylate cyclase (GGDEF)-like protein
MILPEMNAQQVMIVAEKIQAMVENLEIMHREKRLHVTIGLGIATYPLHAGEKEELIATLYTSKHNGKNRVSLCEK